MEGLPLHMIDCGTVCLSAGILACVIAACFLLQLMPVRTKDSRRIM